MEVLPVVAGWAMNNLNLQKVLKTVGIASLLSSFDPIHKELGTRLSKDASIILPSASTFESITERWVNQYSQPHITTVVVVKTEQDVEETVCTLGSVVPLETNMMTGTICKSQGQALHCNGWRSWINCSIVCRSRRYSDRHEGHESSHIQRRWEDSNSRRRLED